MMLTDTEQAKVERVARAICNSVEADNFDELPRNSIFYAVYIQQARAAIAAMYLATTIEQAKGSVGLVEPLWLDWVCKLVDDAFLRVSRNPSDHETATAYRFAIVAANKAGIAEGMERAAVIAERHDYSGFDTVPEAIRAAKGTGDEG